MLRNPVMPRKGTSSPPRDLFDRNLNDVVQVIIHEFNGNTSAFFESIRPPKPKEELAKEEKERLAGCFAKLTQRG